jgi:ABC-type nitrate/sulfonate/bicarbonate transport system permease component
VTAPARIERRELPGWATTSIAVAILVVVWQIAGETLFQSTGSVPTPTEIVRAISRDPDLYWRNLSATLGPAMQGWLWGNLLAIGLAFLVLVVPQTERPVVQLGITSYCLPAVAIAPVLRVVFDAKAAGVVLAGLAVFFTTLVGALVGLRSADPTVLDVVHAYGGGRRKMLTKVRIRASLPSLFAGLRIAGPAAVLGAIVGEYTGADRGIGVAMLSAQAHLDAPAAWALALVATAAAAVIYALTAVVGRLLTPWAPRVQV